MHEVAEALAVVLQHARSLTPKVADLTSAVLGQVLAADISADIDLPPFDKSLRDGYAVRAADCRVTVELRIVEEVAAGMMPVKTIGPGECTLLYTGAPIPAGADAVVIQEQTEPLEPGRARIDDTSVKPGQFVFPRGQEMRAGEIVLHAGEVLNPATLGLLASVGKTEASLVPRPRVGVLATGDELVEAHDAPGPAQIRNSNGPMLTAQTVRAGGLPRNLGTCWDKVDSLRSKIEKALGEADVLVLAGGVSAGKLDLVPGVLRDLGVVSHIHGVNMKPGKPFFFGMLGTKLVFGLPGNPVSALVCFELFVRPALRALSGFKERGPTIRTLPLAEEFATKNDRPTYHPVKLEPTDSSWLVRPLPTSGSADLRSLHPADGLLVLPAGEVRYRSGERVSVIPID